MLHFSRNSGEPDLSQPLLRIRDLSLKVEQKIDQRGNSGGDEFIETLSVEELKDLRQVILASEYLLTKYQDKRDIRAFLADFIGIIMHAANSVNAMKDDLEDLVISAEFALKQIQTLHHEVVQEMALCRNVQTRMDDFKAGSPDSNVVSCPKTWPSKEVPSPINLTNPTRAVHTSDYLERTEVEI